MRQSLVILAGLGIHATTASAQWEIHLSEPFLTVGRPTVTVTLSIEPPPGDYAVAAVDWSMEATEGGWHDQMPLLGHPGQVAGTVVGSSITGITAVQLASAGYDPTPGRIDVWKADFSITAGGFRVIDFATVTSRFLVYPTLSGLPAAEPRALPVEGGARIEVIPAPSSLAALGLAGLAAVRCRRPHIGAGRGGKET